MIKYVVNLILLTLYISSCGTTNCTVDKKFVANFNKKIQVIKSLENHTAFVSPEDYGYTLIYLSKITGITSRSDYTSTLGYRDREIYKDDLKKYREWLKNNRCKFTNYKADSIMHANGY